MLSPFLRNLLYAKCGKQPMILFYPEDGDSRFL
jgi:hypothetical protein